MQGLVIKTTGNSYGVLLPNGTTIECYVKGNFRIRGIRSTNPVAVGDNVQITTQTDGTNWITEINDRKNYIIRRATNLSKKSHIIAANVDLAVLVVTLRHPETSTTFIDRFLATAEAYNVPAAIIFNKTDLLSEPELTQLNELNRLYNSLGYQTLNISANNLTESDKSKISALLGRINLISGNSGVGKSTLLNAILGENRAKTGHISDIHDKGMHTTTFSEMYELDNNHFIIDTPGIKGFGSVDMQPEEVGHYFREIFAASRNCQFSDCRHTSEQHCAVKHAVADGQIAESRYISYLSMLTDSSENKYR